jgi:hypothetical protein
MQDLSQNNTTKALRILYPIWVLIGIFSIIYVPSTLIEYSDATATAQNILDHTLLYRLGIAGSLITQLLFIIIPLLLYKLLESVDKNVAVLMVVFALVSIPITMFNETNKLIVTQLLDEPNRVMDAIELYNQGMNISTIFWGLWLIPLAWLVYKSPLFPKFLGVLLLISGLGYVLGSFVEILMPDASGLISILEFLTIGEVLFIIWLVIMGVKTKTSI